MERRNLGIIRVGPQAIGSIVGYQFVQCFFYGMLYHSEEWILGCDIQIIYIAKVPSSVVKWLVVCINVEKYW